MNVTHCADLDLCACNTCYPALPPNRHCGARHITNTEQAARSHVRSATNSATDRPASTPWMTLTCSQQTSHTQSSISIPCRASNDRSTPHRHQAATMSCRPAIIEALTAFYRQVVKHPYLDDNALKISPSSGWDNINSAALRELGKSEDVIELLKNLPYLEGDDEHKRALLVANDTSPVDYTRHSHILMEKVNPLPGHCVYLTQGVDREGYSLILDTEKGTPVLSVTNS